MATPLLGAEELFALLPLVRVQGEPLKEMGALGLGF